MSVVCVVVDNGEKDLGKCIQSLRRQSIPVRIVIASGPKTDLSLAEKLADKVYPPIEGIGKARVNAILKEDAEFIISMDSDTVYDSRYVEYAVEDLRNGAKAVKAGVILPLEWDNPVAVLDSALSFISPYEFAMAFKKSEALKAGLVEELEKYGDNPRWDIGWFTVTRLGALPDFRMKCWTRLPTKWAAYVAENYAPSAIGGLIPIAVTSTIVSLFK